MPNDGGVIVNQSKLSPPTNTATGTQDSLSARSVTIPRVKRTLAMGDFTLVEPRKWEYDLHSVYSAFMGYFQKYSIPWYERSWGHLFESFEQFLSFSWPVITVTDASTGRAHIVTRLNSIGAFLKMIKTRFGETLPQPPNILQVVPFETGNRHLRHVADYSTFRKLFSTLPAALLSALRARIKAGDPTTIRRVWETKEKTFLCVHFEWNERNEKTILEFGYAAVRCGGLEAQWPPNPDTNYRKGHYIVSEYVDKVNNKHSPTFPRQYAFGDSQFALKAKLPHIVQAVISSFATPESETSSNTLVVVGHNMHGDLARLEELKIKLPHNVLVIDTMIFERALYSSGARGTMPDPKGDKARPPNSSLPFEHLLYTFTSPLNLGPPTSLSPVVPKQQPVILPSCTLQNAGNHALMSLFAFQKLLEPGSVVVPSLKKYNPGPMTNAIPVTMPFMQFPIQCLMPPSMAMPMMNFSNLPPPPGKPGTAQRPTSAYDLSAEFGQMSMNRQGKGITGEAFLSVPGRPGEKGSSKRFHSFPGHME